MNNTNTTNNKSQIIYPKLSYEVVGVCFKIHNDLGRYLSEKQYCDALEQKLKEKKIPYKREYAIPVFFDGERKRRSVVDFLIDNKLILEIKAKRRVLREDYYQVQRYLKTSEKKLGIIINFQSYHVVPKRIVV